MTSRQGGRMALQRAAVAALAAVAAGLGLFARRGIRLYLAAVALPAVRDRPRVVAPAVRDRARMRDVSATPITGKGRT